MDTLLLDTDTWDFVLDSNGNWAVASDPYSQAQDAASACRLFNGELWYDTTKGVLYWELLLGQMPPLSLFKAQLSQAALTVPGVISAVVFVSRFENRDIEGQVQIKNDSGQTSTAVL